MSFSKNIKHCRVTINMTTRHFVSGGSETGVRKLAPKGMALTQWKVLSHLKEYYLKYTSSDNNMYQTVNKEFAKLLQKMQPTIYGDHLIRQIDTKNTKDDKVNENKVVARKTAEQYNIPRVLTDLKLKIGISEVAVNKPKWLTKCPSISQKTIMAKTNNIVTLISMAESHDSKIKRIDDLSTHILTFPEARHQAVKQGAVRLLLGIRSATSDPDIHASIREALAIVGYTGPLAARGIRILTIDGGGTRGILVIEMLKKIEELTGKRVYELFDLVVGVSTGAIITCALGAIKKDLVSLSHYYKELSLKIFSQNPFWGTSNLFFTHSYYDTKVWENFLKEYFGEEDLMKTNRRDDCPKVAAVSVVVNQKITQPYVFRNYCLPYNVQSEYIGGVKHKVWEAVRASSSAPTYFEECKLGELLHQDGGIMVNNPTAVAIHEARHLWPHSEIQCVVSFGTGRTNSMHMDSETVETGISSWKNKFMKILDSATDTERVHSILNDLLPPNTYYRFNPYLTEMIDMSENRPEKLGQLESDALMYLHRNEDKFQSAAKKLLETRTPIQKVNDWVNLKREIFGINPRS